MERCKECKTPMTEKPSNRAYVKMLVCPKCGWFTFRPDRRYKKVGGTQNGNP